jgi:two-component system cell cycle response regulator CpdR
MPRPFSILFVENDSAVRELVRDVLSREGFFVVTARDGYQALCVLMEHHVDLLLTDIVMPGISGIELAKQAKLIRPHLKVLFYTTGQGEEAADRQDMRGGRVLPKPVRPAALLSEITTALSAAG